MWHLLKQHWPNRFFWSVNLCFWVVSLSLLTYIQHRALVGTENEISWWRTWVLLSPWMLHWIWISAGIFILVRIQDQQQKTLVLRVQQHVWVAAIMLNAYWLLANLCRGWLVGRDLEDSFAAYLQTLQSSAHMDVIIYLGVLALALGMRFYHHSMEDRMQLRKLQIALVEEQLKTLHSQLNPHFLFNALNTIASLVRLKREQEAVKALASLSKMLRKILENKNNADVPLKEEVAFIEHYLLIQKMRFDDKLATHIDVDDDCLPIMVPNMLLHPLVENAIQHGSQSESKDNPLQLTIQKLNGALTIRLLNRVAAKDQHTGFGIGVGNTKARLARIYEDFSLTLQPLEQDMFETKLAIPLGDVDG